MDSMPTPGEVVQTSMIEPIAKNQSFDSRRSKIATIALVDSLVLSRDCLVRSLLPQFGQEITIESFASIEEMISSQAARFDLLLFYIHNRAADNFQALIEVIGDIHTPVLVITDDKATDLRLFFGDGLLVGICGLVSAVDSDSKLLSAAARFALSGGTFLPSEMILKVSNPPMGSLPAKKALGGLTPRQAEVFVKLQQGKPNKVIAYELGISESTTKVHIRSIMNATGAPNRTQAVSVGQKLFGFKATPKTHL